MSEPTDPFEPPRAGSSPVPETAHQAAVPVYGAPPAAPPYGAPVSPAPYGAPLIARRNGFGVAALVLGILSILGLVLIVPALILGLLALIFGVLGRRRAKRGEADNGGAALAGLITGAIGFVLGAAAVVAIVAVFLSPSGRTFRNCLEKSGNDSAAQQQCQTALIDHFSGRSTSAR